MLEPARRRASELDKKFAATKELQGPLHGVPVRFFLRLYLFPNSHVLCSRLASKTNVS